MNARGLVLGIALLGLTACSRGKQTLYVASDRTEALTVTINGKLQHEPTTELRAYHEVNLVKGAEVVIEAGGVEVEHLTLPPVEEREAALLFVGGAPGFELVDYRSLYKLQTRDRRAPTLNQQLSGISRSDIEVVPIDRTRKVMTFDQRAAVVGPSDRLPGGGQVNQFTLESFPIYRVERIPTGADPFETIAPKVNAELGIGKAPGTRP